MTPISGMGQFDFTVIERHQAYNARLMELVLCDVAVYLSKLEKFH